MVQFLPEEIFIENSPHRNKWRVKRLLREVCPYVCEDCGIGNEWNEKELVLQLEHRNGDSTDDRLENLCWLCPNCHSQTSTFAGRNSYKGRKKIPYRKGQGTWHKEKLERDQALWETVKHDPDIRIGEWGWKVRIGKRISVSPQKVPKWLQRVDPGALIV